jgi:ribosomal protein S18 acetylase RimI-like enzyme
MEVAEPGRPNGMSLGSDRSQPEGTVDAFDGVVRPMQPADARVVAQYHYMGIPTGFISQLGVCFLRHLYLGISASREGFVLVAVDRLGSTLGFIAGGDDTRSLYASVLRRRGWILGLCACRRLLRPSIWRRVLESWQYPSQALPNVAAAELLAVVVAPSARGGGVAGSLMKAFHAELYSRGIPGCRVIVGTALSRANAFYRKHGFRLAGTILSHGHPANVYVLQVGCP